MPFQPVPNTVEIVVRGIQGGQNIVNTFFAKMSTEPDQADCQALADAVDAWVGAEWLPILSAVYEYSRTDVRGLSHAVDVQASSNDNAGAGAVSGTSQANNVSIAVQRNSGLTGRASRGRIFVPGIADSKLSDDNHISTTFRTELEDALAALVAAIVAEGFSNAIVHRVSGGSPLVTAVVYPLVEWVVTDLVVDSMRRRLPGRGT